MPVIKTSKGWFGRYNITKEWEPDPKHRYGSRQTNYYPTKKEAADALIILKIEVDKELDETRRKIKEGVNLITFNDAYDKYYNYQSERVRATSLAGYRPIYDHIRKYIGDLPIRDLTVDGYMEFKKNLTNDGLSTNRKNKIHQFVKTLIKFTNSMYGVNSDVPDRVGRFYDPTAIRKEMDFYTFDEYKTFIAAVDSFHVTERSLFFRILYYQGLRKGEVNGLRWTDIDFNRKEMNITRSIATKLKGKKFVINPPKRPASYRRLPIANEVMKWLEIRHTECLEKYSNFSEDWYIIGGAEPIGESWLDEWNKRAAKRSGLRRIRIHDFRHSTASLYISYLNCPASVVQKLLGHKNLTTTLDTYTHMFPNVVNEAIDMANRLESVTNGHENSGHEIGHEK